MATTRSAGRAALGYTGAAPSGKNYLLVIGIDQYRNWSQLSNAVRDATDFTEVLLQQYQFEPDTIFSLFDDDATEANIYKALRDMKRRLNPEDNLLVYYSGHGHYDDDFDEGYWIPVDAQRNNEGSYISNANIVKRINSLDTQHTLMIVDSCFSGSLVVRKRNAVPDERFKSRRILASGRHETVSDGKEGENSPFASGLLTYLRHNTSPKLDTTSVIKYVKDYVYGKAQQHPVDGRIQNSADEGGEFVFHLKRDEEAVWQEVTKVNTVEQYRNYIAGFPTGKHVATAKRRIDLLAEDETWGTTQLNDTELSYEEYISRYAPNGKYLEQARARLSELKQTREARQQAQAEMADRENERTKLRNEFRQLVETAESHFKNRDLAEARTAYRSALQKFLPGFAPTQEYLEEQINFCQTSMTFLRHYDNGKKAMQKGNYKLAINYFEEALKIHQNGKVEKLVAECQQQLRSGGGRRRNTTQQSSQRRTAYATAPPAKKSRIGLWIGVGALVAVVLLILISLAVEESDGYYSDGVDDQIGFTNDLRYETLVLGSWQINSINVIRDGVAYNAIEEDYTLALLIGANYTFYNDGSVAINAATFTDYTTYYIDGEAFYLAADGYSEGVVNQLNNDYLQITLPFTNGYGTHYLQFNLSRI